MTPIHPTMVQCINPECGVQFAPKRTGRYMQKYCSPRCRSARSKIDQRAAMARHRAKDPTAYKAKRKDQRKANPSTWRNAQLRTMYGITIADFDALLVAQDHKCAICGKHESDSKSRNLCVDHCHDTGKVRGLLCDKCNLGIGCLDDDATRLLAAAQYLMKAGA